MAYSEIMKKKLKSDIIESLNQENVLIVKKNKKYSGKIQEKIRNFQI